MNHRRLAIAVGAAAVALAAGGVWLGTRSCDSSRGAPPNATLGRVRLGESTRDRASRRERAVGDGGVETAVGERVRLLAATATSDPRAAHGAIAGRVIDAETSAPIAGAEITFVHDEQSTAVRTTESGAFALRPSEEGAFTLASVTARGYFPFAPEWGQSAVVFQARARERIDGVLIHLVPAREIAGLTVDGARRPVAGASIRIIDTPADFVLSELPDRFTSNARGEFRLRAPDDALLEATHATAGSARARVDLAIAASHRVVLTLRPDGPAAATASISGNVLENATGEAIEGAAVSADHIGARRGSHDGSLRPTGLATTDSSGRFTIEGLDPGPYVVRATHPRFAGATTRAPTGATHVMLRLDRGATLRGVVRDRASGAPVPSFTVVVSRRTGPLEEHDVRTAAVLDARGRFEVEGLSPGAHRARVVAHGYSPSDPVDATVPGEIDVTLGRGGTIRGTVIDAASRGPIEGARVTVEGRYGMGESPISIVASATTGADGRFELSGLTEGLRSVVVSAAGHHTRILSGLAIAEGRATAALSIDLTPVEDGGAPRIELVGIGAVLSGRGDALVIGQVMPAGGAAAAGIAPGDRIVGVDGVRVVELGFEPSIQRIRGPEGSAVLLDLRRGAGANERVETVRVERRRVVAP